MAALILSIPIQRNATSANGKYTVCKHISDSSFQNCHSMKLKWRTLYTDVTYVKLQDWRAYLFGFSRTECTCLSTSWVLTDIFNVCFSPGDFAWMCQLLPSSQCQRNQEQSFTDFYLVPVIVVIMMSHGPVSPPLYITYTNNVISSMLYTKKTATLRVWLLIPSFHRRWYGGFTRQASLLHFKLDFRLFNERSTVKSVSATSSPIPSNWARELWPATGKSAVVVRVAVHQLRQ